MLRIASVSVLYGHTVRLELTNGTTRVLDLLPMLRGPLFRPLVDDIALFRRIEVVHGARSWPSGQDLDPDVLLHTKISRTNAIASTGAKVAVSQLEDMVVHIWPSGYDCPHVLVICGSARARVKIGDGEVLQGALPELKLEAVQRWLVTHRSAIALAWVQAVGASETRSAP